MANRNRISLLKSQRAKLKKQRALATTPQAKALVDRRIQQVTVKIENAQKLLKGSSTPKALPPAKNQLKGASTPNRLPTANPKAGPLVKSQAGALTRRGGGGGGLVNALTAGAAIGEAYRNSNRTKSTSARDAGRATFNEKTKKSKATSREVGPKAVEGGYTISRKNRKYKPRPTAKKIKQAAASTSKPEPKVSKAPKPIPKKDRMANASKDKRMAAWAKANAKMIRKSGTAKQRAILDKVENKPKKSAALKAGYPGNRNY